MEGVGILRRGTLQHWFQAGDHVKGVVVVWCSCTVCAFHSSQRFGVSSTVVVDGNHRSGRQKTLNAGIVGRPGLVGIELYTTTTLTK